MVRHRGMRNVRAAVLAHVAIDATIVGLLALSLRDVHFASVRLVALQTATAIKLNPLVLVRPVVRIVTRNAAEFSLAGNVAAALLHLLELAHRAITLHHFRNENVDRPELVQRQTRAKIEGLAAAPQTAVLPLQMALLANGVAQPRLQLRRVHDRVVVFVGFGAVFALLDVEFAWAVATLATNAQAGKCRFIVSVLSSVNRVRLVAVTIQAFDVNGPIECALSSE